MKCLATVSLALALTLTAASAQELAPTQLDLWATNAGDIHSQAVESSVARFNAAHSGVEINANIIPAPYPDKVAVAMSGGQPPQIYAGFGGGVLAEQVAAGKVYALDGALDQYPGWFDSFLPGVMTNATIDGKIYAVPMNGIQPVVLFYNKQVFADAGVEPPQTWDDLMSLVEVFKGKGIIPIAVAGARADAWTQMFWLSYLTDRNGGPEPIKNVIAGEDDAWSDPAFLKAAQMIRELVDAGAFGTTYSSTSYANGQTDALMYTGRAAMQLQGTWDYSIVKGAAPDFIAAGNYGYVPFPALPDGEGDPNSLQGNPANFYSISNNTTPEQLAAALAYLHDEVSSEQYADDFIGIGYVPAVQGIGDKLSAADDPAFAQFIYDLAGKAPTFQLSWDQALKPSVAQAMLDNLNELFNGTISPEQFVTNMNNAD